MKKKEEKRWRRWRRRKEKKESGSVKKRKSGEGNDLEVSLKTRKGTKIYEIPKLPLIIIWVITFFPPYKNSSSNFTIKKKKK